MAHRKAGGSAKNLRDSNPKYLGVKLFEGQIATPGSIIIRQRGTTFLPGDNTRIGKDHTIFSVAEGKVTFEQRRKTSFTGAHKLSKRVHVR
jgi:large subunit ribosomal protein L27